VYLYDEIGNRKYSLMCNATSTPIGVSINSKTIIISAIIVNKILLSAHLNKNMLLTLLIVFILMHKVNA